MASPIKSAAPVERPRLSVVAGRRAKLAGYFIRVFFVGTESPAINAARITQRFIKGGHEVPITKIVSRFGLSMANSVTVARIADRAYFYDNTPEDHPVRLIFHCKDGKAEQTYGTLPAWAEPIWKSLRTVRPNAPAPSPHA